MSLESIVIREGSHSGPGSCESVSTERPEQATPQRQKVDEWWPAGGEGGLADAGRSPEACPASCRLARPEDPGGRGAPCGEPRPTTHGRPRPQGWSKRPLLAHLPESPACQAASRGGASARGGCLFPRVRPASLPHKLKHTSVPRAPPDSFHVGLTSDSKVSPSRVSREESHRLTHPSQPGPGLSSPPEALLRPVVPPPACSLFWRIAWMGPRGRGL